MKTLILILSLCSVGNAFALRCGNNLVYEGDSVAQVVQKCGEPASQDPDSMTYSPPNSWLSTVKISHGKVTEIEENRQ